MSFNMYQRKSCGRQKHYGQLFVVTIHETPDRLLEG